jgi:purine-nucleoside phosphorylase
VLQALGTRRIVLTAAVGGIAPGLAAGDLVALSDHLNLLGANPLTGPNDEALGTRFPDMTAVYSPVLRARAHVEAARLGIALRDGVYAAVPGPSYETPAEVRMLRALGADVVGMSTVPEAIAARHAGMEVLGLALVANAAAGISEQPLSHAEVLAAGQAAAPRFQAILEAVLSRLDDASA